MVLFFVVVLALAPFLRAGVGGALPRDERRARRCDRRAIEARDRGEARVFSRFLGPHGDVDAAHGLDLRLRHVHRPLPLAAAHLDFVGGLVDAGRSFLQTDLGEPVHPDPVRDGLVTQVAAVAGGLADGLDDAEHAEADDHHRDDHFDEGKAMDPTLLAVSILILLFALLGAGMDLPKKTPTLS